MEKERPAGLNDTDPSLLADPVKFFGQYSTVALMANSESLDLEGARAGLPPDTLFVFFARGPRVLSQPFDRDSALCHRMKGADRTVEGEKHARRARKLFANGCLKAEFGLFARHIRPDEPSAFNLPQSKTVDFLIDVDDLFNGWYTTGKTPTTGFALAMWLSHAIPSATIYLCGFTGVRGPHFRMLKAHDWALEQIVLRLLYDKGRLIQWARPNVPGIRAAVKKLLPDIEDGEIALVAADVVNDRLNAMDILVAKLWSLTSLPRAITNFTKRLRWKQLRAIGRAKKDGR